jgi:small subunit ribosomal protein S16
MAKPFAVKMDEDKVKSWIGQGAQPSTQAASLFRRAGIIAARPSKPTKKAGATKAAVKRARPRKVTERKTRAKAHRAKVRAKVAATAKA